MGGRRLVRSGGMNRGSNTYSGPLSRKERIVKALRYRFVPPTHPFMNPFQRIIWRAQRLILGDNGHRKKRNH